MFKRIASLLLACVLLIGMLPMQTFVHAEAAEIEVTDPEPTDPEPTDPEPTDPEPTDPEPTDPEPTDPEPTDPEPTDPEPTDPEPTDPEPTDPEPTDPEPTDPEPEEGQIVNNFEGGPATPAVGIDAVLERLPLVATASMDDNAVYEKNDYDNGFWDGTQRIYDDHTVNGSISSSSDIDAYSFVLSQNSDIQIYCLGSTVGVAYVLYNSNREVLYVSTNEGFQSGLYCDSLRVNNLAAGTYYIAMEEVSSYTAQYKFHLNINPIPNKPHNIGSTVQGIRIYWKKPAGVTAADAKYGVWRSTSKNGTYQHIATVSTTNYLDTSVESGKTYYYAISSYDIDLNAGDPYIHSGTNGSMGITFVETPVITLRVNRAVGIGLTWTKSAGATGYAVYRKSYSGSDNWVRIATITDGNTLSWNDTSVKSSNGTVYKYTVRALAGSSRNMLSGCRSGGMTMARLTSLSVTKVAKASNTSATVTWTRNSKATGYEIRFLSGDQIYTSAISNNSVTKGTFKGLPTGYRWQVQIRSCKKVAGVGIFYSAWSSPQYITVN